MHSERISCLGGMVALVAATHGRAMRRARTMIHALACECSVAKSCYASTYFLSVAPLYPYPRRRGNFLLYT